MSSPGPSASQAQAGAAGTQLGEERFNEVYEKALLRKRLFKEYIQRHEVLDKFNKALEALYECGQLPEDPMAFITEQLKAAPVAGRKPSYRPTSATFKRA